MYQLCSSHGVEAFAIDPEAMALIVLDAEIIARGSIRSVDPPFHGKPFRSLAFDHAVAHTPPVKAWQGAIRNFDGKCLHRLRPLKKPHRPLTARRGRLRCADLWCDIGVDGRNARTALSGTWLSRS
jgi:hypothetical protein